MTVTVKPVDTNYVQQVWPDVADYLQRALTEGCPYPDWSHDYTLDHVQGFLTSGFWLLLVAFDDDKLCGAGTIAFSNCPKHRIAVVTTAGGKFLTCKSAVEQVKVIAKQQGATKIQAFARPSMVRLLQRSGYEPRNTLVEMLV